MQHPAPAGGARSAGGGSLSLLSRLTGPLSHRISAKIIIPYILVIALLAAGGTFIVVRLVATSLDERLVNQLADAGRKANDAAVNIEEDHLRVFRAIAYTDGVDRAIQQRDLDYLNRAIQPIQVNSHIALVQILDAAGNPVLSTELTDQGVAEVPPDPGIAGWQIVQQVLARQVDDLGDKFSALVPTLSHGWMLYTAGPVRDPDDRLMGIVLVGTTSKDLVTRLTRDSLAAITLYDSDGKVIATTLPFGDLENAVDLSEDRYRDLRQHTAALGSLIRRRIIIGERPYDELVGLLDIRKQPAVAMGVAVPSEYIEQKQVLSRDQLIALFTAAVLAVLLLGFLVARRITQPLLRLVAATSWVEQGRLDVHVPPTTEDETGILTESFNQMVAGLRERERVKDTFGKYMGKEETEYLLSNEVKLGGEEREISILLSDIRSFTSLSEGMRPEDLVAFLNRYFSRMVACILRNHGRVDKYMGDAILASFGAPVPRPNHAEDAVRTALDMRGALLALNREFATEGVAPIRIGIGINSGTVVIGNIGSEERLEYTIIGDAVNTTQRIEDLTKDFATDILIAETTYEQVKHLIEVAEPHLVTVRGRSSATAIYPIVGLKPGVPVRTADADLTPIILGADTPGARTGAVAPRPV